MVKQLPISLHGGEKGQARTQFAALCYRLKAGKVQVLLITSRKQGRWIVPKGWPLDGKTPAESAEREAWEEAGVIGKADPFGVGVYSYAKDVGDEGLLPCLAVLYPVKVERLADDYPEKAERKRRWVSCKKAARLVAEPELSKLIAGFAAQKTGKSS